MVRILKNFLDPLDLEPLRICAEHLSFEAGRQGTGYAKARIPPHLFTELRIKSLQAFEVSYLGHDSFFIRYAEGALTPPHKDPSLLAGGEHHRLNAMVTMPEEGGELVVEGQVIKLGLGDAYVFRSDTQEHEVKVVKAGVRLVWSVGVLRLNSVPHAV